VYDPCHKVFHFSDEQVTGMQIECWQKRPTRIRAVELTEENAQEVAEWVGGEVVDGGITIPTLEGPMHGSFGGYIIEGVRGEHYCCRRDIFFETYEKVE